jgi:hypothetical protein
MEGLIVCPVCHVASKLHSRCDACGVRWGEIRDFQRWFAARFDLSDPAQAQRAHELYPAYAEQASKLQELEDALVDANSEGDGLVRSLHAAQREIAGLRAAHADELKRVTLLGARYCDELNGAREVQRISEERLSWWAQQQRDMTVHLGIVEDAVMDLTVRNSAMAAAYRTDAERDATTIASLKRRLREVSQLVEAVPVHEQRAHAVAARHKLRRTQDGSF